MKKETILAIAIIALLFLLPFKLFAYNIYIWQQINPEIDTAKAKEIILFINYQNELKSFSEKEVSHMKEVWVLYWTFNMIFYISLFTIACFFFQKAKVDWIGALKKSGEILLGISVSLILFVLFLFNFAFTLFHQLFFSKNSWIFDSNSLLVKMLPQEFFFMIATIILTTIIIESLLLLFYSRYIYKTKNVGYTKRKQ
ncbi:MAG: DUF1461 domain-containing protein [Candidatus Woesearchaeota archaeon]